MSEPIEIRCWIEPKHTPNRYLPFDSWEACAPDHLEVNASAESEEQLRDYIQYTWNQQFPDDPRDEAGFDFVDAGAWRPTYPSG